MSRFAAAAVLLVTSAGCTGLFHSTARLDQVYFLRAHAASSETEARPALADSIHVARPAPGPGLDSSHIVLLESDRRMSYYMASRWPAALPEVVEELAVESLTSSGSWAAVQSSGSQFPSDYLLQIRIRRFEADYTSDPNIPAVHVALDCTLGRRSGREIIATFAAEGSAKAGANRLSEVVAAFEDATGTALASLSTLAAEAARQADQKVDNPVSSINR